MGELAQKTGGQRRIAFEWRSGLDRTKGDITAVLDDGQIFTGKFFEVTKTTQVDTLAPLWVGWTPWWADWTWGAYAYAGPNVMTQYTGRVLATLTDASGRRMRCRFQLAAPTAGLAGGGQGRCQRQDGSVADAYFPPR